MSLPVSEKYDPANRSQPSGFGPWPKSGEVSRRVAGSSGSLFDVCHVGVLLRAVIFVHAAFGIGILFVTTSFDGWIGGFAVAAGSILPAVLIWLLAACALRVPLGRLAPVGQWSAAVLLGAACGLAGEGVAWLSGAGASGRVPWVGPALAGAGLAAVMFQWLQLRSKALLPADTTARLAELQSRIRPHFLFNTLNSALALVRHDPSRAEQLLEDLAELFRGAMAESRESVSLGEEIALAQRYLDIEQVRFGKRLRVSWDLDPQADHARVPPLLLQPLVENAVRHGIEPMPEGGEVRVRTRARRGQAQVDIVNPLPGQSAPTGHGIALRNVRERLRLMHDVAAQFDARASEGSFHVEIVVPL